jgi:pimeloyl-ACP methyl ester carboxylesterase
MAASVSSANGPYSTFVSARDGLRLHARCYGRNNTLGTPIVCLPGLARTAADFDVLANAFSEDFDRPRRVIALDYRGRGLSDYDRDPANYSLPVELSDVLAVLTALEALPSIFVGTSRGGILTMLIAVVRPTAIAGVVLNDIGPVIEPQGLMRIKSYVGKLPQPATLEEGAEILRRLFHRQFPKLGPDDWLAGACRTFKEENGRLVTTYDPKLATTMAGIDLEQPIATLWKEFDALANVPVMVIRGENSDILSQKTIADMKGRHAKMQVLEVKDQGHAPLLAERETIARIKQFVEAGSAGYPNAGYSVRADG